MDGCRYSDLPKLTRENIVQINGHDYFKIIQKKTGAKVTIPVLPPVRVILEKYDYNIPKPMSTKNSMSLLKRSHTLRGSSMMLLLLEPSWQRAVKK